MVGYGRPPVWSGLGEALTGRFAPPAKFVFRTGVLTG